MAACPCGSGSAYAECCRPYLRGEADAPTAEALMRSRYTAYVRRDVAYLISTWHPSTCPPALEVDDADWRGLDVLAATGGGESDSEGTVTFVAHYATGVVSVGALRETSRFTRLNGRWVYVDGDVS